LVYFGLIFMHPSGRLWRYFFGTIGLGLYRKNFPVLRADTDLNLVPRYTVQYRVRPRSVGRTVRPCNQ